MFAVLTPQKFDAVLTDPMVPTGALIARKFGKFYNINSLNYHICEHFLIFFSLIHFQASPLLTC